MIGHYFFVRRLVGSLSRCIFFPHISDSSLTTYYDVDWVGCPDNFLRLVCVFYPLKSPGNAKRKFTSPNLPLGLNIGLCPLHACVYARTGKISKRPEIEKIDRKGWEVVFVERVVLFQNKDRQLEHSGAEEEREEACIKQIKK